MIITHRTLTKREKARRRFRWWYTHTTPNNRVHHFMTCDGCVGCNAVLEEIERYPEERDEVVR